MKAKKYILKLWAVQTFGGQIIEDQQPKEVEIICSTAEEKKEIRNKAKRRNLWNSSASYYLTKDDARDAIRWALYN